MKIYSYSTWAGSVCLRLVLLLVGPLFGMADESWQFEEVTARGLDRNPPGLGRMFDYTFVDLNDDHLLDIVVNNHDHAKGSPMWIGQKDFTFQFWRHNGGNEVPIAGFFVGECDLDGDGKTDLIYTGNEGGVVFNLNRMTPGARLPDYEPLKLGLSSPQVSMADFTGDGKLEVLVRPGRMLDCTLTRTFHTNLFYGSHTVADFNQDGWPDLFSGGARSRRAEWSGPRRLFRNEQGVLVETGRDSDMVTQYPGGIVRSGDFNNDGHMDVYIFDSKMPDATDTKTDRDGYAMKLFYGDGRFGFTDVTESAGMSGNQLSSGYSMVYLADIDNDRFLDIVNQGNYGSDVWRNKGDGTFVLLNRGAIPWLVNAHLRLDDFDMDGRLDVVTAAAGPAWKDRATSIRVFQNVIANGNHWLKLQVRQSDGNTQALGASVMAYECDTRNLIAKRMVLSDTVGNHPRVHVGLGPHRRVDIEVLFPSTHRIVRFAAVEANQYLVLDSKGSVRNVEVGSSN